MISKFFSIARYLIAAGMLYYLAASGLIEWRALKGLFSSWPLTVLALLLFLLSTSVQALRLNLLLRTHQFNVSLFSAIRLTFIGLFFSAYLPGATGGDLVKIYYVSKGNHGKRTEAITILLLDRFLGLYSLLTLPLLVAPFFTDLVAQQNALQVLLLMSGILAIGIAVFVIVVAQFDLSDNALLLWAEQKLPMGTLFKRMVITVHEYRQHLPAFLKALVYSYISQTLMVLVALAVAQATLSTGADSRMLLLVPMGYLANSLPFTPGGLGVGEAALESLFMMVGIGGGAETLLSWRLVMVLTGLVGLAFYLKGEKRFIFHQDATESPQQNS